MRTRRAVSLSDAGPDLVTYAEGVRLMRERSAADPMDVLGWEYQSLMHGNPTATPRRRGEPRDWSQCQHGTWFFLPWHRMYLFQLERIIARLTGEPEFALPYWDYVSAVDVSIPDAFLDTDSPLFDANRDFRPFPMLPAPETWAQTGTFVALGGGMRRYPVHRGKTSGSLEQNPHNLIHGVVGGAQGDMSGFQSPLDPLFWIHHCNIDRLWEVWAAQPGRSNPWQRSWRRTSFDFPDPDGRQSWTCAEVMSTAERGYEYDDISLPTSQRALGASMGAVDDGAEPPLRRDDRLDLVAASEAPGSVTERVRIPRPSADFTQSRRSLGAGDQEAEGQGPPATPPLYLRLENVGITAGDASSIWNVYLRVGGGERHVVGTIAPFGLAGLTHSGGRQTLTFDISHIAGELLADESAETEVTFEPMYDDTEHQPFWDRIALYTTAE